MLKTINKTVLKSEDGSTDVSRDVYCFCFQTYKHTHTLYKLHPSSYLSEKMNVLTTRGGAADWEQFVVQQLHLLDWSQTAGKQSNWSKLQRFSQVRIRSRYEMFEGCSEKIRSDSCFHYRSLPTHNLNLWQCVFLSLSFCFIRPSLPKGTWKTILSTSV